MIALAPTNDLIENSARPSHFTHGPSAHILSAVEPAPEKGEFGVGPAEKTVGTGGGRPRRGLFGHVEGVTFARKLYAWRRHLGKRGGHHHPQNHHGRKVQ